MFRQPAAEDQSDLLFVINDEYALLVLHCDFRKSLIKQIPRAYGSGKPARAKLRLVEMFNVLVPRAPAGESFTQPSKRLNPLISYIDNLVHPDPSIQPLRMVEHSIPSLALGVLNRSGFIR